MPGARPGLVSEFVCPLGEGANLASFGPVPFLLARGLSALKSALAGRREIPKSLRCSDGKR
jgi:hypothetical protein